MKKLIKLSVAALTLSMAANIATAEGKLSIYHWFEYIPQELLDKFSAEYDVEVTMDTFDSNEAMLASLKAGKMGTYDVLARTAPGPLELRADRQPDRSRSA